MQVLASAVSSNISSDIRIASAYWTLLSRDVPPAELFNPRSLQGEDIFRQLNTIAKKTEGPGLTIVNNQPGTISQGNDTDMLKASGADVITSILFLPPFYPQKFFFKKTQLPGPFFVVISSNAQNSDSIRRILRILARRTVFWITKLGKAINF